MQKLVPRTKRNHRWLYEPTQTPPNCLYKGLLKLCAVFNKVACGGRVDARARCVSGRAVGGLRGRDVRCADAMCGRDVRSGGFAIGRDVRCADAMCDRVGSRSGGLCDRWVMCDRWAMCDRAGCAMRAVRGRCTGCDARISTDWLHLRDVVRGLGFRV